MGQSVISKEMTINQIIRLYPQTMEIFNRFDVDICCGGNRSITTAAAEENVDLDDLLGALNAAAS